MFKLFNLRVLTIQNLLQVLCYGVIFIHSML
uniref:Uncharacterized protein n=1 Tax=Arundo donax TaxID=35708 RepID=A0A0A9F0G2_ARUDO